MTDQRIKGQEASIRIVQNAVVLATIDSVSAFNNTVLLELKEAGYLGETVNRFDEVLNGFGGDMDMHFTNANWRQLEQAIIARARREQPDLVFNVVRTDFFPNGDTSILTYMNVFWGPIPENIPDRKEYIKAHLEFRCSERPVKLNALP